MVSANAHVIAPYHPTIDKVTERFLGKNKIGTTGRGIGPTYADKVNRLGSAWPTCSTRRSCAEKVEASLEVKNQLLAKVYNRRAIEIDAVVEELLEYVDRLRPLVADTSLLLNRALDRGRDRAVRGRPGDDARRRPRHVSVRHLLQRRSRAASAPAPASGRPGSTG